MNMKYSDKETERIVKENEILKKENGVLKEKNKKLEKILLIFCNPHTPPSKEKLKKKKVIDSVPKKTGAPKGHRGATRQIPDPTNTEIHKLLCCPQCGGMIKKSRKKKRRIIEEIKEPQPPEVTEHLFEVGECEKCGKVIAPSDIPDVGLFGKNVLSHITLLKFEDRLPLRKVVRSLKRQHNIQLTHPTILDVTRRVSDKLRKRYKQLIYTIRRSPFVYTDQTEIKIGRVKYQLWTFVTAKTTLFIIRKADYMGVMVEVLGKKYEGVLVGDGLETYRQYTNKIQRCWSHLLREAEDLAEKHDSAKGLYEGLKKLFGKVKNVSGKDPPNKRKKLHDKCVKEMEQWIELTQSYQELKKFGTTLSNGLYHWFTRINYPFVEATNNIAERALREIVVMRNIFGALRNNKGATILERIMTMITTWRQRGMNTFSELRTAI